MRLICRYARCVALGLALSSAPGCLHRSPKPAWTEPGPPVPGVPGDTMAVLRAIVAYGGGPHKVAARRADSIYRDLDEEFCRAFDQDCSKPEPATTWYAIPTPTVRKLAALHELPLIESDAPPLPACPIRPKRSAPNALEGRPVGYQVRAGLRFESPEVALVATESRCDAPPWWEGPDVLLNGNGYRVEYRNGSWRALWTSHVF